MKVNNIMDDNKDLKHLQQMQSQSTLAKFINWGSIGLAKKSTKNSQTGIEHVFPYYY